MARFRLAHSAGSTCVTDSDLSSLEYGTLRVFHEMYGSVGFPAPQDIAVVRRESTGAGRYVELKCDASLTIGDGFLDLGGRYIEMSGVANGLMAVVSVDGGAVTQLEFSVYGNQVWDGQEREWSIV